MSAAPLKIVIIGLSLSSSWGNGHATTYRALLTALAARGHDIVFLECDRPWYAEHRDLPHPAFCRLHFYNEVSELSTFRREISQADLVIVGSYVVDGVAVAKFVRPHARVLAFYDIDTPVTVAQLDAGNCGYLSASVVPTYDLYLSFTGGPTLAILESRYGARAAKPLYCAVDPALYFPMQQTRHHRWDLGYLGTYSTDRQPSLLRLLVDVARLAPAMRFVVAGPQYPSTTNWPENVDRIEHLSPAEHAAFYNASRWTLNITRADMIKAGYSPSVRLFEASACATPIISDDWSGLNEFLAVGSEIVVAGHAEQVLEYLTWPDALRTRIGQAARAHTLRAHTATHRARELELLVEEFAPQLPQALVQS